MDYRNLGTIAGPVLEHGEPRVRFVEVFSPPARRVLLLLIITNAAAQILYLAWLVAPGHWAALVPRPGVADVAAFLAVVVVELAHLTQCVSLWTFSWFARDPVVMAPPEGLRVAMLTTIVPDHEPLDVVLPTLAAMRKVTYQGGGVDVWILDEADDPEVRAAAAGLGIQHFSRAGRPALNTATGRFRARTKAGNHNAWLQQHGWQYDVVAQLDPDHVPDPSFLDRTLGFFRDPDVAFVVAPQVYGDAGSGFVAHGAAAQAFLFHGVVQRGGNGLGAPLLIGTNHVYRVPAWQQIGGYQDCIIEDHLTSMTVHGTTNARTGRRWSGVYTPDVLAVGAAPQTWGEFFTQQRRWAHGAADITLRHTLRLARRLRGRQVLVYALLQSFYPTVVASWALGTLATVAYLSGLAAPPPLDPTTWAALSAASLGSTLTVFTWLRRVSLTPEERHAVGVPGALTTLCAAPIYTAALVAACLRRPLAYHVTRKGAASRPDGWRTFTRHALWLALVLAGLGLSLRLDQASPTLRAWGLLSAAALLVPFVVHLRTRRRAAVRAQEFPSTSGSSTLSNRAVPSRPGP